ncbi:hypothetical protein [Thermococcus sp. Bubb.Bath]|uniref:hypothetical protein n=1 Tax=Thermococcus sp. Bubb.Bath TaxID=1638242 RepID=UPI001438E65F|nr:hypothetical protein [Thermococcus sp. Bubb.Bath]NJF24180.1 hypothetical protein [Thermococcus sp. Bubb.Bath]
MIDLYSGIMGVGGVMVLAGIILTWNLSRLVEKFRVGKRKLSWLILLGGLLTAVGFIPPIINEEGHMIVWALIVGPVLIGYALSESGLVRASLEMLLQIVAVVLSLIFTKGDYLAIAQVFSAVSIILLMNAVAFYVHSPSEISRISRAAAWLFAIFVLLNAWKHGTAYLPLLYLLSQLLWLYTLVKLHFVARQRLPKTAQEGL